MPVRDSFLGSDNLGQMNIYIYLKRQRINSSNLVDFTQGLW